MARQEAALAAKKKIAHHERMPVRGENGKVTFQERSEIPGHQTLLVPAGMPLHLPRTSEGKIKVKCREKVGQQQTASGGPSGSGSGSESGSNHRWSSGSPLPAIVSEGSKRR